jgi:hypothetical protein
MGMQVDEAHLDKSPAATKGRWAGFSRISRRRITRRSCRSAPAGAVHTDRKLPPLASNVKMVENSVSCDIFGGYELGTAAR